MRRSNGLPLHDSGNFLFSFHTHSKDCPSVASKIHACNKQSYKVIKRIVKYSLL